MKATKENFAIEITDENKEELEDWARSLNCNTNWMFTEKYCVIYNGIWDWNVSHFVTLITLEEAKALFIKYEKP